MLNTGTAMQDQLNYVHIHLGPLFPFSMKPFKFQNDKAKRLSKKCFNWPVNKQDVAPQRFFIYVFPMELKTCTDIL